MGVGNISSPLILQSAGNVIYASEWNAEFSNIKTNFNPTGLSGYQDNLAQKQLQEDPATGLVTSLAKELEQLRFALKRAIGETYWYTAPDTDLANALFSGKAGDVVLGDGTKTTTTPLLTLNANTGDAGIRLQVNNTSANAWDIYNDNSDSDTLKFDYNGTTSLKLVGDDLTLESATSPDLVINNTSTGDAALYLRVNNATANQWKVYNDNSDGDLIKFEYNGVEKVRFDTVGTERIWLYPSNISTATAPQTNALYPHSMVKAYAYFTGDATTTPTINDAFNVDTITCNSTDITVTFRTAMADANYAIAFGAMNSLIAVNLDALIPVVISKATTNFVFRIGSLDLTSGAVGFVDPDSTSFWAMHFSVVGRQ